VCFSYKIPQAIESPAGEVVSKEIVKVQAPAARQSEEKKQGHKDDDCPHLAAVTKYKAEIKKLRQELILKGPSKKKNKQ
jgi:hypothetical protein